VKHFISLNFLKLSFANFWYFYTFTNFVDDMSLQFFSCGAYPDLMSLLFRTVICNLLPSLSFSQLPELQLQAWNRWAKGPKTSDCALHDSVCIFEGFM